MPPAPTRAAQLEAGDPLRRLQEKHGANPTYA
jgi:hypothetical protein